MSEDEARKADVFARTRDGGYVTLCGPDARTLGDAIKACVDGDAVIVPANLVGHSYWIWPDTAWAANASEILRLRGLVEWCDCGQTSGAVCNATKPAGCAARESAP